MQAIILAAGMGKRLKELTRNNTKCMVEVNGVSLIDRMLHQLEKQNLDRIVVVVGYEGQKLIDYIGTLGIKIPIIFVENPIYDKTNNIYSLALAKDYLKEDDTLLLESDIILEDGIIEDLLADPRASLVLVDKYENWMDGTYISVDSDDNISGFISERRLNFVSTNEYFKPVNVYKFCKAFSSSVYAPLLDAYSSALGNNEIFQHDLKVIAMLDDPQIKVKKLSGKSWYEINDIEDLKIVEILFCDDKEEKLERLHKTYGGYWRFPGLIDYYYLVNPYFPPKRMVDEMIASYPSLLTQYPSGMKVNALLASRNFNIDQDNIVIGNGSAELIKSLMGFINGKTGFIRPMFEEYPNRFDNGEAVFFDTASIGYTYTADDVIGYFSDKDVKNLVVVNPDMPSGNFIPKEDMLRIVKWGKENNVNIILDESFIDFADEDDWSLMTQDIVSENEHLFIMKSISKSFGVPGLRLGILTSGNKEIIAKMKKDVCIWNINSFAEFYMQIYEKYEDDYALARVKFRQERRRFISELSKIPGVKIFPSQASFLMLELTNFSAHELSMRMLDYNILIRDLSVKLGDDKYIRIAIRNESDNDKLVAAIKACLE